ncbi:MAG: N-6 DNA methylase [Treponematales bacterium]
MKNAVDEINAYLAALDRTCRAGIACPASAATEHSYRPALKTLLEALTSGLSITNEPKRTACGAPDYIVTRGPIPLGYIEAKDIPVRLSDKANHAQFERYKEALPNLILTNYIDFELYADGELAAAVSIAAFDGKGVTPDKTQYDAFLALVEMFVGYQGTTLAATEPVAKILAAKTRLLAGAIEKALASPADGADDQIRAQLDGFKQVLIHDLAEAAFADIYAQTLAYGMFAARLNDTSREPFTRARAASLIPLSNPFLRKFFQFIAAFDLDERIAWIVDALADIFNCVSVEDILTEFARQGQDPYIHFYETFLAEYDPRLRESRGVYYTPVPVVRFIVRAVDDILQSEFGLPRGLADNSKVTRGGKEFHRVQILDPAAGTGTFLAEVIDQIYAKVSGQKGAWPAYCKDNLIPRLNGFEILMASYAMAHFKLNMKLHETGGAVQGERLRVYLTNSLDEPKTTVAELPFAQWLSREAEEANAIKRDVPVLVVIANPPYNVSTQNRNPWIDGLIADYKTELGETNIQPLSDDYIKFIRFGQHLVEKNQSGILAYICNNSFVDGLIHRQMRKTLLECFDTIYILNLHGSARKKETAPGGGKDENVFAIQQGVCIAVFIRKGGKSGGAAQVFHYDFYGRRKAKYAFLQENTLDRIDWNELVPAAPHYFFVPKNFSGQAKYEKGFSVRELFPVCSSGVKTHDDAHLVSFTKFTENNQRIAYRPFDTRFINYDLKKVKRHRFGVMRHFIDKDNIGLMICRQQKSAHFSHVLVHRGLAECVCISTSSAGMYSSFPLYLYPEADGLDENAERTPNLDGKIVDAIAAKTGLRFVVEKTEKDGGAETFAPIDLLDYIYAVLHSVKYREKYAEFLKIDFPRVPYPESAEQFQRLAAYGAALRKLHLLDGVNPAPDYAAFPVAGDNIIDKAEWRPDTHGVSAGSVSINKTQCFENVPEAVWEFYIGGYQPAQKWLKDRKGRALDFDGIEHYQKIITALKQTIDIQARIDEETR